MNNSNSGLGNSSERNVYGSGEEENNLNEISFD